MAKKNDRKFGRYKENGETVLFVLENVKLIRNREDIDWNEDIDKDKPEGSMYYITAEVPQENVGELYDLGFNVKSWSPKDSPETVYSRLALTLSYKFPESAPIVRVISGNRVTEFEERDLRLVSKMGIDKCDISFTGSYSTKGDTRPDGRPWLMPYINTIDIYKRKREDPFGDKLLENGYEFSSQVPVGLDEANVVKTEPVEDEVPF